MYVLRDVGLVVQGAQELLLCINFHRVLCCVSITEALGGALTLSFQRTYIKCLSPVCV